MPIAEKVQSKVTARRKLGREGRVDTHQEASRYKKARQDKVLDTLGNDESEDDKIHQEEELSMLDAGNKTNGKINSYAQIYDKESHVGRRKKEAKVNDETDTAKNSSTINVTPQSSPEAFSLTSNQKNKEIDNADSHLLETKHFLVVVKSLLKNWRSGSKLLTEELIRKVLRRVRPLLMSESMLLRLEAPLNVCGDIHGQITDLIEIFNAGLLPPTANYLFLGDYVDRGKYGTEVIFILLTLKVLYPDKVHLLRGNHETDSICRIYGFFDEVKRRYNVKLFKEFTDVFNCLPVSALIDDIALCMHGGLSPELFHLRQIEQICRPLIVADEGLACDLLWSDPEDGLVGWGQNERGVSYTFGEDVVRKVCNSLGLDIILRAHQVVDNGYQFFANRKLVTIFSASNYCGEFTNSGAMLMMDKDCRCSFQIFKPQYEETTAYKQHIRSC